MRSKLNEAGMQSELSGSAFFAQAAKPATSLSPPPIATAPKATPDIKRATNPPTSPQAWSEPLPTPATPGQTHNKKQKTSHQASMLASNDNSVIEQLRKAVKKIGKEVTFVRLTLEEKQQLQDVVYTYRRQGVRTSDNEISRIAINSLIADYHANGENSILARVISALLA